MKSIIRPILILLLGFSCAKKPEDKYPENYKRDYYNLELFENKVLLNTVKKTEKENEEKEVIFKEGDQKLKALFSGYKLKSKQESEAIYVHFEITPNYLIAFKEVQKGQNLSLEEKLLISEKNEKSRIPLFYLPIKGFGVFERAKNNLNEKTNSFAFKDREIKKSTHVKLGVKEEDRIKPKIEGLTKIEKQNLIDLKNDLDLTKRYIYVPSTLGAPRDISQTSPFFQGQEKIVQMGLSEDGIEVYNIDPNKNKFKPVLKERPSLDETPVLTIPGRYLNISCQKNIKGHCSPVYGPAKDLNLGWKSKRFFIPNLEALKVHEKNLLELQHLKEDGCWSRGNNPKYISHVLRKGVINIQLEKNIRINNSSSKCLNSYWTTRMRHFSFNVRHFYALVSLDSFVPKNKALRYQSVLYPAFDRKVFGFFHTNLEKLNPEGEFKRKVIKSYLSRWNPKRKMNRIYYFLTNTFIEEENEIRGKRIKFKNENIPSLKQITEEAINSLNDGLIIAEAPFKIHLCIPKRKIINNKNLTYFEDKDCQEKASDKIGPEGALPGDIRYNTIALIRPSLGNGLLGYGPNVVHPETGEILHAHVNMYEGNLKRQTRSLWTQISSNENRTWLKNKNNSISGISEENIRSEVSRENEISNNPSDNDSIDFSESEDQQIGSLTNLTTKSSLKNFNELLSKYKKARQKVLGQNLFFADFLNIAQTQKSIISILKEREKNSILEKSFFHKNQRVKAWNELARDQKDDIQRILLVHNFKSTLIHEMGHNLGLRHNFMGSVDKDNFYNKKDVEGKYENFKLKTFPSYSSVMDYAGNAVDSPIVPGKYDIAALKFAYAREVELKNGKKLKLGLDSLENALRKKDYKVEVDLKPYKYCTDFEKANTAYCNPFDHGHNLELIADSMIKKYYSDYERINFRDDKNYFSINQTESYFLSKFYLFNQMRMILSEWDYLKQNKLTMKDQELEIYKNKKCPRSLLNYWPKECKKIEDAVKAAHKIGHFFLSILKENDLTCSIVDYSPEQVPHLIDFYNVHFKEEKDLFLNNFNVRKLVFIYLKNLFLNKETLKKESGYNANIYEVIEFLDYIKNNSKKENIFEDLLEEKKLFMSKLGLTSKIDSKKKFVTILSFLNLKDPTFKGTPEDKKQQKNHLLKLKSYLSKMKKDEAERVSLFLKQDLLRPNKKRIKLADKLRNLKDLSHFTYLPKSCFDKELISYFNKKEKYDVYNQKGRYLVGFNDQNPEFRKQKLKNIAVRGIWPDKILAMESLIQRRPMFGRKIGLMSFLDLPEIKKEFNSLINNSLFSFPNSKIEKSLGSLMIPSYNIPNNLKGILGVHSSGDLLNLKKGMFSFSNIRNGGIKGGLLKTISVKRKNETDSFNPKDHLYFNYDDTVYLVEKENEISFQILSFLKRVELLENSKPEELQLIIDENKKLALSKEKSDSILGSLNGSIKRKEDQLRDFLSYKSFDGIDFLNKIFTFFNEKDLDYISFKKYYTLINFKKDYDDARYASKESKIDNLFHKSLGKNQNPFLKLSNPQKKKTAYISQTMYDFSKEIQEKKELIKWGQDKINQIILILENEVENDGPNLPRNLEKSIFTPDKADQEKLILNIFKRKDINKLKVTQTLNYMHFYSLPYKLQLELNSKVLRLFKTHSKTKDTSFNQWKNKFKESLKEKGILFDDLKANIEKWAVSPNTLNRFFKGEEDEDFIREEKNEINLILISFFDDIELSLFSEEARESLLNKIDLNYYTFKSLPKSTTKKLSIFFKGIFSKENHHLPEEIQKIDESIKYQLNFKKYTSKDHLKSFIKINNQIKLIKNETGNDENEKLKSLKNKAFKELKYFLKKFNYSSSLTEIQKLIFSSFTKIFKEHHTKEKIFWAKEITNLEPESPIYLKGKIKSIENDLLFNEFNYLLNVGDGNILKNKIQNSYKDLLKVYEDAIKIIKSEKSYLTYNKMIHETRNLNFKVKNFKEELSNAQIKEIKDEINRIKRLLKPFGRSIPRYLKKEKRALYLKFFNYFLKNFSEKYNNLFNLTYNWFEWRRNKDFSFKNEFYSNEEITGCDFDNWSKEECTSSIQNLILKSPFEVYKKGEELSYIQMRHLNSIFSNILRFNYQGKKIFDNDIIPNKIKSLNFASDENHVCNKVNDVELSNSADGQNLKRNFNKLYNCTKNLFELGINKYINDIEKDLDEFLKTHIKDYYHGPYPSIFNKYLRNKSFFQKFKESGLMVLTLPPKNRQKIILELRNTFQKNRKDELKTQGLDDLFLFELETFNTKNGRGLLLELKKTYQQVLKTLPTEWKQKFSK